MTKKYRYQDYRGEITVKICGRIGRKRKDEGMHIAKWCCVVCAAVLAFMGVRTLMAGRMNFPEESFALYSELNWNIRASGKTCFLKLRELTEKGHVKEVSSSNVNVATAEYADKDKTAKPVIALKLKGAGISTLRVTYCDGRKSHTVKKRLVVEQAGKNSYRIQICGFRI